MSNDLKMLLIGGAIGCLSSMIGIIISHCLTLVTQKHKYKLDLKYIEEKRKIEDIYEKKIYEKELRDTIADPDLAAKRRRLAEAIKNGESVKVSTSGTLLAPDGKLACFTAKMRVLTDKSEYLDLPSCKKGDKVFTINLFDKTLVISTITDVISQEVKQYIIINDFLEITGSHIVYLDNFVPKKVEQLRVGDYIYTRSKELVKIFSLKLVQENTVVYNLVIDSNNPIVVENTLVSNYETKVSFTN